MLLKKVIAAVLYACILVAILVIIYGLISNSTELSMTAIILGFLSGVVQIYIFFQEKISDYLNARRRSRLRMYDQPLSSLAKLLETNWRRITGNGIDAIERIESYYRDATSDYLVELRELSTKKAKEIEKRRQEGDPKIWDGERFRLIGFSEGRTQQHEDYELTLRFENSRYSNFLATIEFLNQRVKVGDQVMSQREYYLSKKPEERISELVSDFGVALLVVTSDNKLIMTKRKDDLQVCPGLIHLSCHEGLARSGKNPDFNSMGKPDVTKAAIRALDEELFLKGIEPTQIVWLLFGHDTVTWEYNLFGLMHVNMTMESIYNRFRMLAKDKELEHDFYTPPLRAEIDDVINFLKIEWNRVHQFAKVAIFYAMINITQQPEKVLEEFNNLVQSKIQNI